MIDLTDSPLPALTAGRCAELAGHRAAVEAIVPVIVGARDAYRSALGALLPSVPDDLEGFIAAWAVWETSEAGQLREVLDTLGAALRLLDYVPALVHPPVTKGS